MISSRSLVRAAALASAVLAFGAQTGLAAPFSNQTANVFNLSHTSVLATHTSLSGNLTTVTQVGGPLQTAIVPSTAVTTSTSVINAVSGNSTTILQF
jgi:hypothetical protein